MKELNRLLIYVPLLTVLSLNLKAQHEKLQFGGLVESSGVNNLEIATLLSLGAVNKGPYGYGYSSLNLGFNYCTNSDLFLIKTGLETSYIFLNLGLHFKTNFKKDNFLTPKIGTSYFGLVNFGFERNVYLNGKAENIPKNQIYVSFRFLSGIIKDRKKSEKEGVIKNWWW